MALSITTGFTTDGLVFMLMEGQQTEHGRPIQTTVTIEPDMAEKIGHKLIEDSKKAANACNRPLIVGQNQKFSKG